MEAPDYIASSQSVDSRLGIALIKDPAPVVFRCGVIQTVLGIVVFIIGIADISLGVGDNEEPVYSAIAAGIWCGMVIILAGAVGIVASKRQSQTLNMSSMILSCLSVIFCVVFLVISSASLDRALNPKISKNGTEPDSFGSTASPHHGHSSEGVAIADAMGILFTLFTILTAIFQAISSYQREPFSLSTLIFVIGRCMLGCCCKKVLETQGYAREEDFSSDI